MSDNLDRTLGRMEATLENVSERVKRQSDLTDKIFASVDTLKSDMATIRSEAEELHKRMVAVEVPVKEFSRWRERAVGASMLLSFIAAASGASLAAGWEWIMRKIGV